MPRAGYRFTAAVRRKQAAQEPFSVRWPIGVLPAKPAVSELIGQGRSCLLTASLSEVPKAVEAFRSAVALDPNYAPAHAGLALARCAQAELRLLPLDVAYADARAAALRALAMDAVNADAQVALQNTAADQAVTASDPASAQPIAKKRIAPRPPKIAP